jgi:FAD-dependent urate hydroxylase
VTDVVDVAIVGAGPYGLSLAAHLRSTGLAVRQFGFPMRQWRSAMPRGMFLKSQGFASNLSSPDGGHTLEAYCAATGRRYASYGLPVSLDTFVSYGRWFQQELALEVEETLVTGVVGKGSRYELTLGTGERLLAARVAVAAGVEHFPFVPEQLSGLRSDRCTHSSAHTDLSAFAGRRVVVLGAGQSALESAALLHESGVDVRLVARDRRLAWNGPPLPPSRPLLQRLREPEAGLGSGWSTWFYSSKPELFRLLPRHTRVYRARTALGPAGAPWLSPRVQGKFPVILGHALRWADADDGAVRLGLRSPAGEDIMMTAEHVIAATGYRSDLRKLTFLDRHLRQRVRTVAGTPAVDRSYQSTVAGLYFLGPVVAPTFGPVMRFVYGCDHAARAVARDMAATAGRRAPASATAGHAR